MMRRLPILLALALPAFAAFGNGYTYRRSITVGASVVPSTQTNFPMLVYGTYSYLATTANSGLVQHTATLNSQTVPTDLIFTSDLAGSTLLKWDVASYTATSGAIEAWVQVPSIANGTVIYMFYGAASVTTYQGSSAAVWTGSNYQAVWHLANGTTQSLVDSSGAGNGLTNNGTTAAAGQIDGASANPGTQPHGLAVTTPVGLANLATASYSLWVKPAALTDTAGSTALELVSVGGKGSAINPTSGTLGVTIPTSITFRSATSTTAVTVGAWAYIVFTYSGSSAPHIYLNGAEVSYSAQNGGSGTNTTDTNGASLGNLWSNTFFGDFPGSLDEARIASVALSANWIAAEYNNQSSPSTFYAIGAQSLSASGGGFLIIGDML